jgi:hypothetical protein
MCSEVTPYSGNGNGGSNEGFSHCCFPNKMPFLRTSSVLKMYAIRRLGQGERALFTAVGSKNSVT